MDLRVVRAVGHCFAFGGQNTSSHPPGVLILLQRQLFEIFGETGYEDLPLCDKNPSGVTGLHCVDV